MYTVLFTTASLIGVIIGLIGVGGGILLFPVLMYYGFTVQQAVSISLFLNVVPNTLPALYMYYREGHLPIKHALIIAVGSVAGIAFGGYVGAHKLIPDVYVIRFYTALVFAIGVYMLFARCELRG